MRSISAPSPSRPPSIPVLFNCLGDVAPEGATIQELLVRQVQSSVYMEDTIRAMADYGPGRPGGDRSGQGPYRIRTQDRAGYACSYR